MENKASSSVKSEQKTMEFKLPELKYFFKAGVQFGHQAKKWNPKMRDYIFDKKNDIHIIDVSQTLPMLKGAMQFLYEISSKGGQILFVGSKRQARDIVKKYAIESGTFYVINRWPGGLMTNFNLIKSSLKKFNNLESEFESGVEGRTKFEISQMKKDWVKMNRLYEGIKTMNGFPQAIVVVDSKYERGAIKEAKLKNIPVVALVDTNADPTKVDYPIVTNDDAIKSIELIVSLLSEAIKKGNNGRGIKHTLRDYTNYEVKIKKAEVNVTKQESIAIKNEVADEVETAKVTKIKVSSKIKAGKGILERIQEEAETKKVEKAETSR
jgi:small subunit ribosomal protein S2